MNVSENTAVLLKLRSILSYISVEAMPGLVFIYSKDYFVYTLLTFEMFHIKYLYSVAMIYIVWYWSMNSHFQFD